MINITKNEDGTFTVVAIENSKDPATNINGFWTQKRVMDTEAKVWKYQKAPFSEFLSSCDMTDAASYKKWVKAWKQVNAILIEHSRLFKYQRKESVTGYHVACQRASQVYDLKFVLHRMYAARADNKVKAGIARQARLDNIKVS